MHPIRIPHAEISSPLQHGAEHGALILEQCSVVGSVIVSTFAVSRCEVEASPSTNVAIMDLSGGPRYVKLNDKLMSRGQIVLVECDSEADIDSISQRGCASEPLPTQRMYKCFARCVVGFTPYDETNYAISCMLCR